MNWYILKKNWKLFPINSQPNIYNIYKNNKLMTSLNLTINQKNTYIATDLLDIFLDLNIEELDI